MAVKLRQEEELKVKKFIEEVNYYYIQNGKQPLPWKTAVKFLMARKFDIRRALDLYRCHQLTREGEDLLYLDINDKFLQEELQTEKFTILGGRDSGGAAIALFTARYHFPTLTSHQNVLKALIYQLDAALESFETQKHGLVFIYDMTDSKYGNFDYNLSIKILNMLKGAYPARLKKVLIVAAPLWFKASFRILQLFLREKLRDRVFTVAVSELPFHIPCESLPKQLGGHLVPNHNTWLKLCFLVATNQDPDMSFYFNNQSLQQVSESKEAMQSSDSAETETNIFASDFDSSEETSRETVSEKYNEEEKEKEGEEQRIRSEKEVIVEKETPVVVQRMHSADTRSAAAADTRKRSSDTFSPVDENQSPITDPSHPCKRRPVSLDSQTYEESLHMADDSGIDIETLADHVRKLRKKGLRQEYLNIRSESPTGTFYVSKAKCNLPKNRYLDVLCYDHSRVVISMVDGDPNSDYINANFVDGYKQKNAYITTQGCLSRTTGDFWRMVWEQKCLVIVMLTRIMERNRLKCEQYWPLETDTYETYDHFVVHNSCVKQSSDYQVSTLILKNNKTGEERVIQHMQFIRWPDYGVPHKAEAFLQFLSKVRTLQAEAVQDLGDSWHGHPLGPPIVVHCSAGIGRTGTLITIDINIHRLEDIGTVNTYQTVRKIRSQRAFSIQVPDQYVFCHLALIEYAVNTGQLQNKWLDLESDSDSDD
ncbi:tyrosine-protein phosphatase non-receptor type 9 isoform X2 [Octopus vulgaris]|uniref:Tyrosine-protein phosphatase non-receptor type 9 isoform X2 n=3 Tax=Octopus TaxID=6643 RepID=A0AA36BGR0_OCTVU|nr:tyrosine-protein phosphatase non-receptor type 9 isoform X1 [Octopus sinensis]CAI9734115.1 tyrosine-protein phosphatase non-receptor type 9 isoform X2 [Octopus vulgaris]